MLIKQITENCAKLNARRNLFGPVDHEKTDFWLRQRLTEMQQKSTEKWGFNFATGQPCHDENSNFQWSSIQTGCDSQPQSSGVASASVPSYPLDAIASGCDKEFSSSPLNRKSLSQPCQKTPTSRTTSVDKLGKRHSLRDSTGTTSRSKQARVTDFYPKRRRLESSGAKRPSHLIRAKSLESACKPAFSPQQRLDQQ